MGVRGALSYESCKCNAGGYRARLGQLFICSTCPDSMTSSAGSIGVSGCVCNAGWFGNSVDECQECERGKYCAVGTGTTGGVSCSSTNSFLTSDNRAKNLTDCYCEAGAFLNTTSEMCEECRCRQILSWARGGTVRVSAQLVGEERRFCVCQARGVCL